MKNQELKQMPKAELLNKINELKKELVKHNAQIAIGTAPKSPGHLRQTKKTIARILTILKQGGSK